MRNYITLIALFAFISCQLPPDPIVPPADDGVSSYQFTGYSMKLVDGHVQIVGNYVKTTIRGLDDTTITDFGKIPGGDMIVKASDGYYRINAVTGEDTLLDVTGELYLHQFFRVGTILYYGLNNSVYSTILTDITFGNDIVVATDTKLFTDISSNKTNLQYFISGNDIFYFIRDNSGSGTGWYKNGIFVEGTYFVGNPMNSSYFGVHADGTLYNVYTGVVISPDVNDSEKFSTGFGGDFNFGNFSTDSNILTLVTGWGQEQTLNDVAVLNRMDASNTYYYGNYGSAFGPRQAFNRDTMFRSFRDNKLYFESNEQRSYLVLTASNDTTDVKVESFTTTGIGVNLAPTTDITIPFEVIDSYTKLIPNMWVDTDGSVLVAYDKTLTRYMGIDATGTLVTTLANRIDAFTVLPNGEIILMDMFGDWWEQDGVTPYLGDNIVAQY